MRALIYFVAVVATAAGNLEPGAQNAAAQVFPSRQITMNVAFPAGGALDSTGRILAEHMRMSLGQPVIMRT